MGSTPPRDSPTRAARRRRDKKKLHMAARETRAWYRVVGLEEESPCEMDSPTFSVSTISTSDDEAPSEGSRARFGGGLYS